MKKPDEKNDSDSQGTESKTSSIRLPGFVNDDDVGLGDAIKQVSAAFGIKPCGGCERRAATLNRWVTFSGRRPK